MLFNSKFYYCTKVTVTTSKQLYRYLLRECQKLPDDARQYYLHAIKQSFKQHVDETDPDRVNQMIQKSLSDAEWILNKVRKKIKMFRVPLITGEQEISEQAFWNSVFLYHTSPHLANRRILGVSQLFILQITFNNEVYRLSDILKYSELYSQVYRLKSISSDTVNESVVLNILEQYGNIFSYYRRCIDEVKQSEDGVFVAVKILLPRNYKIQPCLEFVIIDKLNNVASFLAISNQKPYLSPNFRYDLELEKSQLMKICVENIETAEETASDWLVDVLFPKLITWTEEKDIKTPVQKSLSLLNVEKYCILYHQLKLKYADNIVKNWTENTDPIKFVHEDIAIATYLILLWQRYTSNKQKFVDLGCGNGLLVHILNQEGHTGYGIDIRRRKIWNLYPKSTKLKVETIAPSSKSLYPDADWLIGNHSDELTPWIPVMTARSSNNCKYFLLPCCSFEFHGKKYQRSNSSKSQYQEYLEYVKNISDICGFKTEIDRLRIPSTKRICLVGVERQNEDFNEVDKRISGFINSRCHNNVSNNEADNWINNFEARPVQEIVRNCTKLNKTLVDSIVKKVISYLLFHENHITLSSEKKWNAGGVVPLSLLIQVISAEELKQLKNECGGLQTLLKNNHYIFIVKNGTVQIRMPVVNHNKHFNKKVRKCWFYEHHPDGCPLDSDLCSYIH